MHFKRGYLWGHYGVDAALLMPDSGIAERWLRPTSRATLLVWNRQRRRWYGKC